MEEGLATMKCDKFKGKDEKERIGCMYNLREQLFPRTICSSIGDHVDDLQVSDILRLSRFSADALKPYIVVLC